MLLFSSKVFVFFAVVAAGTTVRSARAGFGAYGEPRDVSNFSPEQLLDLRYEYTPEITGMLRECTKDEEREARERLISSMDDEEKNGVFDVDENGAEERRFGCSRYFIELGGECFEGPGRAHVSYERKPMRVYFSEIDERDGGFTIISEYLGEEEGRMYSRVEYLCEAQTAFVREGIDGYKDEEDKFVLPYNAFLMDDDVKIGSGEKRYLHYQSMDTSWYNGNKFE